MNQIIRPNSVKTRTCQPFLAICFSLLVILPCHAGLINPDGISLLAGETKLTEKTKEKEESDTSDKKTTSSPKKKTREMPSDTIVFPNTGKPAPPAKVDEDKKSPTEENKKSDSDPMTLEDARKLEGRIPLKITRYAEYVLNKYDLNKNGQLDHEEWGAMPASPEKADLDLNKIITLEEITFRIANYGRSIRIRLRLISENIVSIPSSENEGTDRLADENDDDKDGEDIPAPVKRRRDTKFYVSKSRLPGNLPASFIERDNDGDAQLTLKEFAENPSKSQIQQFHDLDMNNDGLVTAKEYVLRAPRKKKSASKGETPDKPAKDSK